MEQLIMLIIGFAIISSLVRILVKVVAFFARVIATILVFVLGLAGLIAILS